MGHTIRTCIGVSHAMPSLSGNRHAVLYSRKCHSGCIIDICKPSYMPMVGCQRDRPLLVARPWGGLCSQKPRHERTMTRAMRPTVCSSVDSQQTQGDGDDGSNALAQKQPKGYRVFHMVRQHITALFCLKCHLCMFHPSGWMLLFSERSRQRIIDIRSKRCLCRRQCD